MELQFAPTAKTGNRSESFQKTQHSARARAAVTAGANNVGATLGNFELDNFFCGDPQLDEILGISPYESVLR